MVVTTPPGPGRSEPNSPGLLSKLLSIAQAVAPALPQTNRVVATEKDPDLGGEELLVIETLQL
jgi:hypothetical protein